MEVFAGREKPPGEACGAGGGASLPACPAGAITFEEREAPAYDREAVLAAKGRCSGSRAAAIQREAAPGQTVPAAGLLSQWPVQIKLVPVKAPYFNGAKLLVAADCTAYAYGNFHQEFIRGHITLIGCPKLDEGDYGEKLTQILAGNDIKSVTIARMEVPCCGGLENAVRRALQASGKFIPWNVVTVSTDGRLLD